MKKLWELLVAGVLGATIVMAAIIYSGEKGIEKRASQVDVPRPGTAAPSLETVAASTPPIDPEWPGAAFPSDAWKNSELEWYVQWKRVRKYARIAYQTSQPAGFPPLKGQARELWANVAGWSDGRQKSACLPAAEQLHKALSALDGGEPGGFPALQASETAGDKCRAAAQAAMRRR
ncbi:MAG TPA: hypothetical protein VIF61_00160 [Methylocystis sp.]